jgi:hypothetical protein
LILNDESLGGVMEKGIKMEKGSPVELANNRYLYGKRPPKWFYDEN